MKPCRWGPGPVGRSYDAGGWANPKLKIKDDPQIVPVFRHSLHGLLFPLRLLSVSPRAPAGAPAAPEAVRTRPGGGGGTVPGERCGPGTASLGATVQGTLLVGGRLAERGASDQPAFPSPKLPEPRHPLAGSGPGLRSSPPGPAGPRGASPHATGPVQGLTAPRASHAGLTHRSSLPYSLHRVDATCAAASRTVSVIAPCSELSPSPQTPDSLPPSLPPFPSFFLLLFLLSLEKPEPNLRNTLGPVSPAGAQLQVFKYSQRWALSRLRWALVLL